jgi:hypothetical protein
MLYDKIFEPTFTSSTTELIRKWCMGSLKQLMPHLKLSRRKGYHYLNQYDFLLDWIDSKNKSHSIRVEIKTSRAVDFEKPDEPLYNKALASDSKRPFDMNFQQIKPKCADVFLWIAVWRDKIIYWILSCSEVKKNKYFSKGQHRGNIGEGQLHLNRDNIAEFKKYEVISTQIKEAIIQAYKREKNLT